MHTTERSVFSIVVALFIALGIGDSSQRVAADVVLYTVPGTSMTFLLMGNATVNPGGTISFRHPRGMLYFGARDCRIIRTNSKEKLYVVERSQ
ncbi:MAG: hypothetical protein ACR2NZ_22085, partial [Rubripirellula sp.]